MKDTSGPAPLRWEEFPRTFTQRSSATTCQRTDEMPRGRNKAFHSQGVVAKVKYVPDDNDGAGNGFTGMLGSGSDTILLRFSESMYLHEDSPGLTPSVALKWLRDDILSANVLAQVSIKNSGSWNFFENPFTTTIPGFDDETDQLWTDTLQRKMFDGAGVPFVMGVGETYATNLDGTNVDYTTVENIPYMLEFTSQWTFPASRDPDQEWYEQLMSITNEKPLLDVYAWTDHPDEAESEKLHIGVIELLSDITTSVFGDERLFF